MSKSSIVIYLESSPPFLLELIYSCVFSIILIVFIFTVRERTQSFILAADAAGKHLQKNTFTTKKNKRIPGSDSEVIYSNDKILNSPQLKVHYRSGATDGTSCSETTSDSPTTNRWSQDLKESIEELTIFHPSPKILRTQTLKRDKSHSRIETMHNNSSATIPPIQEHPENIDDMTPEEYESYVQSMTSIWNKLFSKSKSPTSHSHSKNVLPTVADDSSLFSEQEAGVGSREWKRRIQKIWTRNDISKTDSTLAIRGSESEINIRVFTESEIKMVEQPFKESTDSMYSNCLEMSNDVLDSEVSNMSGDDCKKSQFDVIYEEK